MTSHFNFSVFVIQQEINSICAFDIVGQDIYELMVGRDAQIISLDMLKVSDRSSTVNLDLASKVVSLKIEILSTVDLVNNIKLLFFLRNVAFECKRLLKRKI